MDELRGFSAVRDNVIRRQEFERGHPAVVISHHEQPAWHWTAEWVAEGNRFRVCRDELGPLLDELDVLLGLGH